MPHQDRPQCPNCESWTTVVPIEVALHQKAITNPPTSHRLYCVGCDQSYEGTGAEVDQAIDAQDAWQSMKREWDKGKSTSFDPRPKARGEH
jgi:hypothetical protein